MLRSGGKRYASLSLARTRDVFWMVISEQQRLLRGVEEPLRPGTARHGEGEGLRSEERSRPTRVSALLLTFMSSETMTGPPHMACTVRIPRSSAGVRRVEARSRMQSGSLRNHRPCMAERVSVLRTALRAAGRFILSQCGSGNSGFHDNPASADTRMLHTAPTPPPTPSR